MDSCLHFCSWRTEIKLSSEAISWRTIKSFSAKTKTCRKLSFWLRITKFSPFGTMKDGVYEILFLSPLLSCRLLSSPLPKIKQTLSFRTTKTIQKRGPVFRKDGRLDFLFFYSVFGATKLCEGSFFRRVLFEFLLSLILIHHTSSINNHLLSHHVSSPHVSHQRHWVLDFLKCWSRGSSRYEYLNHHQLTLFLLLLTLPTMYEMHIWYPTDEDARIKTKHIFKNISMTTTESNSHQSSLFGLQSCKARFLLSYFRTQFYPNEYFHERRQLGHSSLGDIINPKLPWWNTAQRLRNWFTQ